MSEVKVNKITPTAACGTVTLGDSGDTLAIPCGVTLSNAGSITNSGTITNTGTISGGTITGNIDGLVSWDTTAKTTGFTAVAGNGYFVNTTSGEITVTLPATPSAGDLVGIKDYANTADTNAITIGRNGSNIQGAANDFRISTEGLSIILIYVDGTQGWVSTGAAKAADITENIFFVTATGGTVTTCGNYKIHTFTGPGTFCVSCAGSPGGSNSVDYLVIAGGGGGGGSSNAGPCNGSGAGGAGGFRESHAIPVSGCYTASPLATPTSLPVSVSAYPITVGAGGSGGSASGSPSGHGSSGSNSIFSTITSAGGGGGGGGGSVCTPTTQNAYNGGSGGGGGDSGTGGTGNTPPVSPSQGNNGSPGIGGGSGGGGGGGAGAAGGPGLPGGSGASTSITTSPVSYSAGGNGTSWPSGAPGTPQPANSGNGAPSGSRFSGGTGGSGIVVIRYKYQ